MLKHFPKLIELKVCFNLIQEINELNEDMIQNLRTIDLESNPIGDWKYVNKLGELRKYEIHIYLKNLIISKNFPIIKSGDFICQ